MLSTRGDQSVTKRFKEPRSKADRCGDSQLTQLVTAQIDDLIGCPGGGDQQEARIHTHLNEVGCDYTEKKLLV
jgi:hypothetical protein